MFNNIQLLRAVAAAMVFFFHADPHYQALRGGDHFFSAIASFGYSGVDIFFVISGFVVAHTTLDRPRTLAGAWTFARRRMLRIYLGYWPFLLLTLVLAGLYTPAAFAEYDLPRSFLLATIDAQRMALFVTWSLSFELLFYGVVTATFVLPAARMRLAVYVAVTVVFLTLLWTLGTPHPQGMMFLSFFFEFLVGFVIYIHWQKLQGKRLIPALTVVVIAAFGAGAFWQAGNGSLRILTFGTGAIALVMLALVAEHSQTLVANKFWTALGDSSYTLYLFHPPFLAAFYWWGGRDLLAAQPEVLRDLGFFLVLGLGFWTSHLLYQVMERPLYRWASTASGANVSL